MTESEAIVVKNAGSHFLLSRLPEWEPFPAVLRGKVRLKGSTSTNPVAVGDKVRFKLEAAGGTPSEGRNTRGSIAGGPSRREGGVSPKGELPEGDSLQPTDSNRIRILPGYGNHCRRRKSIAEYRESDQGQLQESR